MKFNFCIHTHFTKKQLQNKIDLQNTIMRIFILFLFCFLSFSANAQQSSSKAKSKDKLYDKEGLRNIELINATAINSPNLEFSPVYYQNGLVYVSSRYKAGAIDKKIGETYFELFYSEFDANGNPTKPQEFSVNINSQRHEGPVAFSKDGNRIYFTRNNMVNGKTKADSKGTVRLKVYEAKRGPFDWEDLRELSFNSDEYSVMHPTISVDGQKMFFSSDMPGGFGGFDLYMVYKKGAAWTSPINLGNTINTDKNEAFPFIHKSGTLFFSSEGHDNLGGLDIFQVDVSNDNATAPVINLGAPFNSESDDLGFILNKDGTQGFFTSGRPNGVGKDDIYHFKAPDGLQGLGSTPMVNTQIQVTDANTGERIADAGVRIIERAADGFLENGAYYDIDLLPADENSTELVMKLRRKDAENLGKPSLYTDNNGELVQPLEASRQYLILVTKEGYKNAEKIITSNPNTDIYNIALNKNTCIHLAGKLTNGMTALENVQVEIINNCNNKIQNIRSNADGEIYVCLPETCTYTLTYSKDGYSIGTRTVNLPKGSQNIDLSYVLQKTVAATPAAAKVTTPAITKGSIIVLENIYYDFNKSAIRKGDARELESLVSLMRQYPSMKIDLTAHTDSRGTAEYNMDLSLQRANSAKQFLVTRGIASNRINAFGMGETQVRNHCLDGVNCDENEHQYNRRTEVKITHLDESVEVKYRN